MLETDLIEVSKAVLSKAGNASDKALLEQIEFTCHDGTLTITCPTPFIQHQVVNRYKGHIQRSVQEVFGEKIEPAFLIRPSSEQGRGATVSKPVQMIIPSAHTCSHISGLNPRFTFEDFVVGKGNAFAYQAAMAVSEQETGRYNPLYFHSDIGLGKSHISHAIANRSLMSRPQTRARYMSARDFSQEYVEAVRNNTLAAFKNSYRASKLDILFLDDIHLFASKEKTQVEFAGIMDDLVSAGTQVILSGYRPPCSIPNMDKGLSSRISSGLSINIKRPDRETRLAIIVAKARKEGYELDSEVGEYIADQSSANVRELESAVLSIVAMGSIMKREITLELAKEVLGSVIEQKPRVDISMILDLVVKNYGIKKEILLSTSRKKEVNHPRQIAIYLCRKLTDETLESIGNAFNRKHTSVIHALEVMDARCQDSLQIRKELDFLMEKFDSAL